MNNKKCIYCGKSANTREHIPAKQFFKGKPDKSLITVPSCDECNKSFQKDEDFFRQFWVSMLMDKSTLARSLMENEITRFIRRKPALGHQLFNRMQLVEQYTKFGIYLGKKTIYKVIDTDRERINRIVVKIIKGLFFHEFGEVTPEDWIIKNLWITNQNISNIDEIGKILKWTIIKEDTFIYGVSNVPKTYQSAWILVFFGSPLFYVLVLDEKIAAIKSKD